MKKTKSTIPKELRDECHLAIHSATAAAATAGAIPIPMADAVPISAAQIAMIVRLGKIFGIELSKSTAKSIASVAVAQQTGRAVASTILKSIPGGQIVGSVISATVAASITEALGWIIAEEFYKVYKGEEPEDILGSFQEIKGAISGFRTSK